MEDENLAKVVNLIVSNALFGIFIILFFMKALKQKTNAARIKWAFKWLAVLGVLIVVSAIMSPIFEDKWLLGYFLLLFVAPISLVVLLYVTSKWLSNSSRAELSSKNETAITIDEKGNAQFIEKEFEPKTRSEEVRAQMRIAFKFGVVVQLGLAVLLFFLQTTMASLLNDTMTAAIVYGFLYILPVWLAYDLVGDSLYYRNVVIVFSCMSLGATLFALHLLSRQTPTVHFGRQPFVDTFFLGVQFLGMALFAPLVALIVNVVMAKKH